MKINLPDNWKEVAGITEARTPLTRQDLQPFKEAVIKLLKSPEAKNLGIVFEHEIHAQTLLMKFNDEKDFTLQWGSLR